MITREALYHRPKQAFAYVYEDEKLHIRFRSKKGEIKKIFIRFGDPYNWEKGGGGGNLVSENAFGWVSTGEILMEKEAESELFDHWIATVEPEFKRLRYAFIIENDDENFVYGEKNIIDITTENREKELSNMGNFFCFPYVHEIDSIQNIDWVKDAIFYQIFPERFCNSDESLNPKDCEPWGAEPKYFNFMGGDLNGITSKIDYIKNLGVNALYLCPVFEAPSNHKYDTTNFKKIDPHFGTNEDFKKLVDTCHENGMKVMIDAVFNHVGRDFPQWKDVLENQEDSIYKDWFVIKKFPVRKYENHDVDKHQLEYASFAFSPFMPKLNTKNPEVREFLIDIATYWIKEFDIDAWRLDVANEIDHSFWREFRKEVKDIKPECLILGEIWHDPLPWLDGSQWDSVMNYPLTDAINKFFADETVDACEFSNQVNKIITDLPLNYSEMAFNLLDSHDTQRIITRANSLEQTMMAYLFQFSQPGSPCIYYGGEIGLEGSDDPDNRRTMPWDESLHNLELKAFIKKLIELRNEHQAFKKAPKFIYANDKQLIYYKDDIYFIFNNDNETEISTDLKGDFINLINDEEVTINEEIKLKKHQFLILKRKETK